MTCTDCGKRGPFIPLYLNKQDGHEVLELYPKFRKTDALCDRCTRNAIHWGRMCRREVK
jgi:hypothetical protein